MSVPWCLAARSSVEMQKHSLEFFTDWVWVSVESTFFFSAKTAQTTDTKDLTATAPDFWNRSTWRLSLLLALLVLRNAMGTRPARWGKLKCGWLMTWWYVSHLLVRMMALLLRALDLVKVVCFDFSVFSLLIVRILDLDEMFKKGAFIRELRFCVMYFGGSPFSLPEGPCGCMFLAPVRNCRFFRPAACSGIP